MAERVRVIETQLNGLTLLYLDDDPKLLSLVEAQLVGYGVQVITADRVRDALRRLKEGLMPDMILCDILMPGQDGREFHRIVREHPVWRAIPFVYLTSLDDYDNYRQSMNQGADGYLSKPFTQKQLVQEITLVLSRHEEVRKQQLIEVNMLGTQNVRQGIELLVAPDRGVEQLVFYLLLQNRPHDQLQPVLRTTIVSQLWGEMTPSGFRSVLSRAKRWSEDWTEWYTDKLALGLKLKSNATCDLYMLERALDNHASSRKLEQLYKGPLLPAYHDDWVAGRRELVAGRVKDAHLEEAEKQTDDRERALALKRALDVDPFDGDLWDGYIQLLETAGLQNELEQARRQQQRYVA
jgi:CheY-like chemotaxis protein